MKLSATVTALCLFTVAAAAARKNAAVTLSFSKDSIAPVNITLAIGTTSDKSIEASNVEIIEITPGKAVGAKENVVQANVECTMKVDSSSNELGPVTMAEELEFEGVKKITRIQCEENVYDTFFIQHPE
jgi:hypothetical protein